MAVKPRPKGRYWVVFWLATFLLVAITVAARQKAALAAAARLGALREEKGALEARRAGLQRAIKTRSSAAALLPKGRPRGLAPAQDTALIYLPVEGSSGSEDRR